MNRETRNRGSEVPTTFVPGRGALREAVGDIVARDLDIAIEGVTTLTARAMRTGMEAPDRRSGSTASERRRRPDNKSRKIGLTFDRFEQLDGRAGNNNNGPSEDYVDTGELDF